MKFVLRHLNSLIQATGRGLGGHFGLEEFRALERQKSIGPWSWGGTTAFLARLIHLIRDFRPDPNFLPRVARPCNPNRISNCAFAARIGGKLQKSAIFHPIR
jgi:hypothetical protein